MFQNIALNTPEFVAVKLGPQQFREIVKGGGQQTRCDKSEQHGVDMHRSHPSEMDILDICQEVRGNQIARSNHSEGSRPSKPQGRCQGKRFGCRIAGSNDFSCFFRQNENSFNASRYYLL